MRNGGNAIDAAVATAFCLGVVNSFSCGLGGGDFWTIRLKNGSSYFLNSREVAPVSATQDMFSSAPSGGPLSIAVPLSLKGLESAWQKFGTLPWDRLVNPAINLAANGFDMHPFLQEVLIRNFKAVLASQGLRNIYLIKDPSSSSGYRVPDVGEECCVNTKLASTLADIASKGSKALYSSSHAQILASEIQGAGGLVTPDDLMNAQVQWRPTLYRRVGPSMGFFFPPPPSSASALILGFSILAGLNASASSPAIDSHRVLETLKHVFAVRANLGDPDYSNLTAVLSDLLSPAFSASLRSLINDSSVLSNATAYGGKWSPFITGVAIPPSDNGTSHVSVVDAAGNAVALTMTINDEFGSKFVSPSTGIILNNEMDDYSVPGKNNATTLSPNLISGGKRPLSSMSPLIVVSQGKLVAVMGASGGTKIISALLQTLARVYLSSNSSAQLLDIIATPRLHDPFLPQPDTLSYENYSIFGMDFRYPPDFLASLQQKGDVRQSASSSYLGIVQAIIIDGSRKIGVSDPRKDGAPSTTDSN